MLVIDVQAGLFLTDPAPFDADGVLGRINAITARARAASVPVIFIQHDSLSAEEGTVPFTAGWQLHPALDRRPEDLIVRKTMCDAFYGTGLEATLRARGVTTLVLMGYATDFCVDATLRNGASKDFRIVVVGDAHTTTDRPGMAARLAREHHNWVWANYLAPRGVAVLTAEQIVFP